MIAISFCITLLIFAQSLLCMENSKYDLTPITNDILVHQIQQNTGLLSHDTICALALVNKHLNKIVEQSTQQRKIYLTKQTNLINNDQITWHKYNSAYAYWTDCNKIVDEREEKQITFNLIHLQGNDTIVHHQLPCLSTEYCRASPLPFAEYKPFFNSKGEACFHAHGQFEMQKGAEDCAFFCPSFRVYMLEYSINTQGQKKSLPCYVNLLSNIKTNKANSLINLINYKNEQLIKNILNNSKSAIETSITTYDQLKIYGKYCKAYEGNIKVYNYDDIEHSQNSTINNNTTATVPVISRESTVSEKELNDRLIQAAQTNNIDKIIFSINAGATRLGAALRKAASNNNYKITELLLRTMQERNISLHPFEAQIAMDLAAYNGNQHIIELLLPNIPASAREKCINSGLSSALRYNHITTVDFLIAQAQNNINIAISLDEALNFLAHDGNVNGINFLFKKAQELKINPYLNQAFITAADKGHHEIIKLLATKAKETNVILNFTRAHEVSFFDEHTRNLLHTLEK